jgi:ABC-2 type transport system ATP-binding protein
MITVEGLSHWYGDRRAIEDLSFSIQEKEIVGFLGLNGAGKSTTLKILAGLVVPTAGTVSIDGVDLVGAGAAFRARIGYLPEDPPLYKEMTVREFVRFCGQLRGMPAADVEARLPEVLRIAQLTHVADRVIGELSHGYKKRCGIAQAIIHKPGLVILDEPISGLDPRQIVEMRQVIRDLAKDCTVLVSSHILGEISETCDRILVLAGGKIVAQGSEQELAARARGSGTRLTLIVRGTWEQVEAGLAGVPGLTAHDEREESPGVWRLHATLSGDDREALVASLVRAGVGLRRMVEDETELETIFLGLTREVMA